MANTKGSKLFLVGVSPNRAMAIFAKTKTGAKLLFTKKIKKGQRIPKTARLRVKRFKGKVKANISFAS